MIISGVEKDFVPKNNPNTSVNVGNSHSSHERCLRTERYLETRRRVTQLAGYVQHKSGRKQGHVREMCLVNNSKNVM